MKEQTAENFVHDAPATAAESLGARFIVCEKSGLWAASLRWQQGTAIRCTGEFEAAQPCGKALNMRRARYKLPLVETRSLPDAREELVRSPDSIVAIEVTLANAEAAFRFLADARRRFPECRLVVLLSREARDVTDYFLEVAHWLAESPRQLHRLVGYVVRHISLVEPPDLPLREAIWLRLPWSS